MAFRKEVPQVSAGSMADITFLLLIFFLVTTSIESDSGMDRMLPPMETISQMDVQKKNILSITVSKEGELLVDDNLLPLKDLKETAKVFLDNGGVLNSNNGYCDYCKGNRDVKSSDNPKKAIVSLITNRQTSYEDYIAVQNEILRAYNELRTRESRRLYKVDFPSLEALYTSSNSSSLDKLNLKEKIKVIQAMYPLNISEANRN